jgi:ankyrin repeat protein
MSSLRTITQIDLQTAITLTLETGNLDILLSHLKSLINQDKLPKKSYLIEKTEISLYSLSNYLYLPIHLTDELTEDQKNFLTKQLIALQIDYAQEIFNVDANQTAALTKRLLDCGMDARIKRTDGYTVLHKCSFLSKTFDLDLCERLLVAGADINSAYLSLESPILGCGTILHGMIANENLDSTMQTIALAKKHHKKIDYAVKDGQGKTLLLITTKVMAAELFPMILAHTLLQDPKLVNEPDHQKRTPLHIASALGCSDLASQLLAAGADPEARDIHNMTPLDYSRASKDTVNTFLESISIDPNRNVIAKANAFYCNSSKYLFPLSQIKSLGLTATTLGSNDKYTTPAEGKHVPVLYCYANMKILLDMVTETIKKWEQQIIARGATLSSEFRTFQSQIELLKVHDKKIDKTQIIAQWKVHFKKLMGDKFTFKELRGDNTTEQIDRAWIELSTMVHWYDLMAPVKDTSIADRCMQGHKEVEKLLTEPSARQTKKYPASLPDEELKAAAQALVTQKTAGSAELQVAKIAFLKGFNDNLAAAKSQFDKLPPESPGKILYSELGDELKKPEPNLFVLRDTVVRHKGITCETGSALREKLVLVINEYSRISKQTAAPGKAAAPAKTTRHLG